MKLKSISLFALLFIFTIKIQAQAPILDSTVCITTGDLAQINVLNNALSIPPGNAGPAQTYDYSVLPSFNSNYQILGVDNLTSPFVEPVFIFKDANALLILVMFPVTTKRTLLPVRVNPLAAFNPVVVSK